MKKQTRKKKLNIYNSDRYFNFHLSMKDSVADYIKVTSIVEEELLQAMNKLEEQSKELAIPIKDRKHYIIFNTPDSNDLLISKLFQYGGTVDYYTDKMVPYYVLKELANRTNGTAIYNLKSQYTDEEIVNIQLTFTACPVTVSVPVVFPDINPYDVLFALHDLKTNVDTVQFEFPRLSASEMTADRQKYYVKVGALYEVKAKYKYKFFKKVQTSLSIWAMHIYMVCNTVDDYNRLRTLAEKDSNKPYSPLSKGGK